MAEIKLDTEKLEEFQKKLIESKEFREKFAANPKEVIKEYGFEVPDEMVPESVDLEALEERASKAAGAAGFFVGTGWIVGW